MASTISLEFRERLLRAFFMPDTYVSSPGLFVALTTKVALANQSGSTLAEPKAGAYARPQINLSANWWALSGFGEIYNSQPIDFPAFTAGEDWGYLMGWSLLDSVTSGTTLAVGSLIQPTQAVSGMPPISLQPGGITIGLFD